MNLERLETKIKGLINPLGGRVGVYVKFLETNQEIALNAHEEFTAASTIKIPILIETFRQASEGKFKLEDDIEVPESAWVGGSGILKELLRNRKRPVWDLAALMIIVSDNTAANALIDLVGREDVNKTSCNLGLRKTILNHHLMIAEGRGHNITTPFETAVLLEKIYAKELPGAEKMLKILKEEKIRDRIPLFLPNDVEIAHKTGSLEDATHDCGLVFSENPFVFCFFSQDQKDTRAARETCGKIAELIYKKSRF